MRVAADTSAWIDLAAGHKTQAADYLEVSLVEGLIVVPPAVLVEVLSGPRIRPEIEERIRVLNRLDLRAGFWERTALLRRDLLRAGLKANLGDCLIAQNCIDEDVILITRDRDFRHFERHGLRLAGMG